VDEELFFSQLREHSGDCWGGYVQVVCDVDGFGVSFFSDEFVDYLDIIFLPWCLLAGCGFVGIG